MNRPRERSGRELLLDRNMLIIFGVTLTAVMGVSSIAPAFPKVIRELDLNTHQVGYLITVFTLPGMILTPLLGVLADRFGRKRVLVPSMFVFALFGGACGLVSDFRLLLALRFVQGMGAASLGALNITILSDIFQGRERITALGYNASVLSLGTSAYPAIGGALAMLGWHYPFFLPLITLPLTFAVWRKLDSVKPDQESHFMEYMKRALSMAVSRRALGLFGSTTITFIILYGVIITYLPIYLAENFGAEPWAIGMVITTASLTTAIMASQLRKVADRLSTKHMIVVAFIFYGLSAVLLPAMPGLWWTIFPACLFGVGQGLNIPSVQTMLAELAPMEIRGAFMALNGMVLRIGQTLGPLVMGAAFAAAGLHGVFMTAAGLAAGTIVFAWFMIR